MCVSEKVLKVGRIVVCCGLLSQDVDPSALVLDLISLLTHGTLFSTLAAHVSDHWSMVSPKCRRRCRRVTQGHPSLSGTLASGSGILILVLVSVFTVYARFATRVAGRTNAFLLEASASNEHARRIFTERARSPYVFIRELARITWTTRRLRKWKCCGEVNLWGSLRAGGVRLFPCGHSPCGLLVLFWSRASSQVLGRCSNTAHWRRTRRVSAVFAFSAPLLGGFDPLWLCECLFGLS